MKTISPEVLLVTTVLIAMVPLVIAVGTCYLKFSIVLSLLRSGFGTQQAPSAAMVTALSVVMSLMVMQPVVRGISERIGAVSLSEIASTSLPVVMEIGGDLLTPWREFLLTHSGERELRVFSELAGAEPIPDGAQLDRSHVRTPTALAAFVVSEIKKGFTLGFFLLIPFFVIDLVVGNLLVAMGLTMMSPVIVSLPIKLLLFVSSDGWLLLAQSLIKAYQ
jgi:type III secretory pathway component EscR